MKIAYLQSILFVCLLSTGFLFAQDSKEEIVQPDYPKLSDTIPSKGTYLPNPIGDYNEAYYMLDRLNENIGLPPSRFNFQTPQATLEHFIYSCRSGNFEDAAFALNLNLFPKEVTKEEAAVLAEKFFFVINQRVKVDWEHLPDRPDGQVDLGTSTNAPIAGKARRSVAFGEIDLDGRDVILRLQRVRLKKWGAFWMISANTVENIEPLYAEYGPRKLDRVMPNWSRVAIAGVPLWKIVGTILLFFIAYLVGRITKWTTYKLFCKAESPFLRTVSHKMSGPAGLALGMLFFYLALNYLISFSGIHASTIYAILLIIAIACIAYFLMSIIDAFFVYVAEHRVGDSALEENKRARMLMTYISVARRVLTIIIIFVAISVILSQFKSLEKLGISLLASAGLITIILGVAAQNTLGNIIAGIQIALTRPASIGDTVVIEGEWGYVEDIRFTYMVVRTWDARRLIVPLQDIVSKSFENWSMTNPHQIRPVHVYADYTTDIEAVRTYFDQLLRDSKLWDEKQEPSIQVTDATEKSIQIRALCSAKDASATWDLHCYLREELVKFIAQMNDGDYLPRTRMVTSALNPSKE